jgi:glycosyltransferase involved in cell wall biosynthesis
VKASVVIPAYNAGPNLQRLLSSLSRSRLDPGDSFEIIVADDGSTDNTKEVVAEFSELSVDCSFVYIFLPRTAASGRSSARNAGIEQATGDLLLLLDADQICTESLVAEHIRYHRLHTKLVVIGPRHSLGDDLPGKAKFAAGSAASALPKVVRQDIRADFFAEFSGNFNNVEVCWHLMFSCNVSVRREQLLAVGGFDENFNGWGLEDSELGYRLRRAGLAFAYNPLAATYHWFRDVTPEMFAEWRRNLGYFISKHEGAADVSIQQILYRVLDPANRDLSWPEGMRRFEWSARALAGRLPRPSGFQWVEAADANVTEVSAVVSELGPVQDLIVVDDTQDAALSGLVQCIDTTRELLYFHRPSAAMRSALQQRTGVTG